MASLQVSYPPIMWVLRVSSNWIPTMETFLARRIVNNSASGALKVAAVMLVKSQCAIAAHGDRHAVAGQSRLFGTDKGSKSRWQLSIGVFGSSCWLLPRWN